MGIVTVLSLVGVTLYMAFAFPYTLMHLKQSETTEIKSVIIVARNGERSPTNDAYFVGEEPDDELHQIGQDQLTNVGKERMYLLGKYFRLKYYNLLLNGNPRKVQVRSADYDRCLESAQALLAGLNPPKENWIWSSATNNDWLVNWQPKAIHSEDPREDDLLSSTSTCLKFEQTKPRWKNSTKYQQLINEFRHDMQTLRQNTGLEFEDDLEMLINIEDSLKTRQAFDSSDIPTWYTKTFASRLSHIADVAVGSRFSEPEAQRLYAGRLLNEIVENINNRIKLDRISLAMENLEGGKQQDQLQGVKLARSNPKAGVEPNMFIYMTDKSHLSALMNSFQVYSSQPQFGSTLLIELHRDPINQVYFLRLFTVASTSPNVFPEPVRVNPLACVDSVECDSLQFEQNIRHLTLDKVAWQTLCNEQIGYPGQGGSMLMPSTAPPPPPPANQPDEQQQEVVTTTTTTTELPVTETTTAHTTTELLDTSTSTPPLTTTLDDKTIEELDQKLTVGPVSPASEYSTPMTTSSPSSTSESTSTSSKSNETSAASTSQSETLGTGETSRQTVTITTTPKAPIAKPTVEPTAKAQAGGKIDPSESSSATEEEENKQTSRDVYHIDNHL